MESIPSEQSIDIAIDSDVTEMGSQPDEETTASRPHQVIKGSLKPTKTDAPKANPQSPKPLLQRLIIHNNGASPMIADTDVPELMWSDCGSEDSDVESSLDEGDDNNKPPDNTHLAVREGPYADSIRELRDKERSRFPPAMIIELEAHRLRTLHDPGVRNSPTTRIPPPRGFAVIEVSDGVACEDCAGGTVVGVAQTLEKANIGAMSYFCRKNRENMCSLRVTGNALTNRLQASFLATCDYRGVESFGFRRISTTRNCSAWGIDSKGCLGLLAVRGTKPARMVYVKETEYFA
ncbi:hypothetical protein F4806DRAFT_73579 [Annulohypoxylon nitens]|nr:hypothetical protein F4806DRAFT_73579 [Annulohypoxylon nitens]